MPPPVSIFWRHGLHSEPPYIATTDANGNVTGVTYQGNTPPSTRLTVAWRGTAVSVDVPGANTTGTTARAGLYHRWHLRGGPFQPSHRPAKRSDLPETPATITTDSANLQKDENNLTYQMATTARSKTS